jgi:hypothetical protein
MGLAYADARNLIELRRGQTGGRAVTLGRLAAYLHPGDVRALKTLVGAPGGEAWLNGYRWGDPADGFFRHVLGFDAVESIDFSAYQGASIVQDIGDPLADELAGAFDLAVDGGTLEHVFNLPVAIGNLMRLVRVGGAVYAHSPANDLCGHGFYQFSPELMFRVFSESNGFELGFVRLAQARHLSIEKTTGQPVYEVADPAAVGGRVNLISAGPVVMMTAARRVRACEPFREKVLQSDYVARWSGESPRPRSRLQRLKDLVRRDSPSPLLGRLTAALARRRASLRHRPHFRRIW